MRTTGRLSLWMAAVFLVGALAPLNAQVQVGGTAATRLRSFDEVPALSGFGTGHFRSTIADDGSSMTWELEYSANLRGTITQAHIHLAQKGVNGGIMVFLCSNLGNGPAGTQPCPAKPATISGTLTAANVVSGANAQGVAPGEFNEVLRAIRAGFAYANVHTDLFPGGEIRGQLKFTPSE
jgi:CHRD domain